jgi:hypothetical protein
MLSRTVPEADPEARDYIAKFKRREALKALSEEGAVLEELWKAVPGYVPEQCRLEASSLGRLRAVVRPRHGRGKPELTILDAVPGKRICVGYSRFWPEHLICTAFHGPFNAMERFVAHRDGDSDNLAPANLYWATKAERFASIRDARPYGSLR